MSDKYGDRTYHEPTPAERDTMLAVLAEHSRLERIADLTGAMATMTDDCYQEHESIGLRCVGQRDVTKYYQQCLFEPFPDWFATFRGMAVAKGTIVVWCCFQGTMTGPWMGIPATGRPFSYPLTVVLKFRGDKMVGESQYYDVATVCEQMGIDRQDLLAAAKQFSSR